MDGNEERETGFEGIGKRIDDLKTGGGTEDANAWKQATAEPQQAKQESVNQETTIKVDMPKAKRKPSPFSSFSFTKVFWVIVALVILYSLFSKGSNNTGRSNSTQTSAPSAPTPTSAQNSTDYVVQGENYYSKGLYQEALQSFSKAIELNPLNSVAYNDKGWTLLAMGRYSEAVGYYTRAIELSPSYDLPQKGMAMAREKLKQFDSNPAPSPTPATPSQSSGKAIDSISLSKSGDKLLVTIWGNAEMMAKVLSADNNKLVIDIPNFKTAIDAPKVFEPPLQGIRIGKHSDKTRLVFDLAGPTVYNILPAGHQIIISFNMTGASETPKPAPPKDLFKEAEISPLSEPQSALAPASHYDKKPSIPKPTRYTDNGNGTVTDNNSGLMWQKQDDGNTYSWYRASNVCGELNIGSYSDWRLPSKNELESIVDKSIPSAGPKIKAAYFPNTKLSYYWSSTTSADNERGAWHVGFDDGNVYGYSKNGDNYVRCVRGGQ